MILVGISSSILNYYSTAGGLIEAKHRLIFWQQVRYSIGLLMYFVGTALSFVDARIALIIYAGWPCTTLLCRSPRLNRP